LPVPPISRSSPTQRSSDLWGQQWGGQQRQLSQQDVNEVVRQLVPALPQILAQAQNPFGGISYAAYGQAPRQLSPQDVNEVVRQIDRKRTRLNSSHEWISYD